MAWTYESFIGCVYMITLPCQRHDIFSGVKSRVGRNQYGILVCTTTTILAAKTRVKKRSRAETVRRKIKAKFRNFKKISGREKSLNAVDSSKQLRRLFLSSYCRFCYQDNLCEENAQAHDDTQHKGIIPPHFCMCEQRPQQQ